ncbi:RCC1 domain-containing protein 1 isoform X2 [Protopterus annectens]|uniref:RCC1 domain-containing protein 1 isoform X2 n=1 Tax=Protopterus annectens TaxID=7888 RepID=UPI001CF9BBEC|nr:RCC1 domain-containing protein 1 isoform X2 [Protopterus annectens]
MGCGMKFWFGFGYNGFAQIQHTGGKESPIKNFVSRKKILIPESIHRDDNVVWKEFGSIRKPVPSWSDTVFLTDSGRLIPSGFPRHFPCQIQGCRDLHASENFLLLQFQDRVECWDTRPTAERKKGTLVWQCELAEDEQYVFPLVPKGYLIPRPPFFKMLTLENKALKLVLGTEHAMMLSCVKTVYSWGSGRHGQLGHSVLADETEPRIVEALQGLVMVDVAAGGWHSVSISDGGDIYIWGWNESGQLGFPSKTLCEKPEPGHTSDSAHKESSSPGGSAQQNNRAEMFISIQAFPALLDLPKMSEVSKVSCGSRHTAAVTCAYGQLGHGDTTSCDEPRIVQYFSEHSLFVLDVVCGPWNTFVCVIDKQVQSQSVPSKTEHSFNA